MAIRNLLHITKIEQFREWAESNGWISISPKGEYEVLRLIKPGEIPLILYRKNGCDHATLSEQHFGLVRQFIMENREDGGHGRKKQNDK